MALFNTPFVHNIFLDMVGPSNFGQVTFPPVHVNPPPVMKYEPKPPDDSIVNKDSNASFMVFQAQPLLLITTFNLAEVVDMDNEASLLHLDMDNDHCCIW